MKNIFKILSYFFKFLYVIAGLLALYLFVLSFINVMKAGDTLTDAFNNFTWFFSPFNIVAFIGRILLFAPAYLFFISYKWFQKKSKSSFEKFVEGRGKQVLKNLEVNALRDQEDL